MSTDPSREEVAQTLLLKSDAARKAAPWRRPGLILLALVVVGGGWYFASKTGDGDAPLYVTVPVERSVLNVTVTATGTLEPTDEVEVSSELSGIVREVAVDYNDPVRKGQVLAELDTDVLEAEVARARATLAAARAQVHQSEATIAEAKRDYERYQRLLAQNAASEQTHDKAKAAYERAVAALASTQADVAVTEADLKLKETNLKKSCICSPVDGVVLTRSVDPGQTVAASFQAPILFTIAGDFTTMDLQVDVDEADVGLVAAGQTAQFTVDAYPDRTFPATVAKVRFAPEEIEGVVTYKTQLNVDNRDLLLRPGMTATADIAVRTVQDAILVPNEALRFTPPAPKAEKAQGGSLFGRLMPRRPASNTPPRDAANGAKRTVWVLQDGIPVAVSVSVGLSDAKRTEIVEGALQTGQAVITSLRESKS